MPTRYSDAGQPPRACDRCHAIKERCDRRRDATQCDRCLRLGHGCMTVRQERRPGRRPGTRDLKRAEVTRKQFTIQMSTVPDLVSALGFVDGVSNADRHLVERFFTRNHLLDTFSVGSSFSEGVRQQVMPRLLLSRATLLDAFLVCAISWADDDNAGACSGGDRASTCFRHASSALATLASLAVTDLPSMTDCLILGAMLSTFAMRLRLPDILAICRRTLGLIEPMYATVSSRNNSQTDLSMHSIPGVFLSCMVMWELRACLFSCAVPTLRFRPPVEAYADRHVGLCATLLPLLYDICDISNRMAHLTALNAGGLQEEINSLECSVRQWQPQMPDQFNAIFAGTDVSHMLCQAQVMRLAMLLILHRLRHPFGTDDGGGVAEVLASAILTQLEMTFVTTGQHVRCTDLPLMVACLELQGRERAKWLKDVAAFAGFSKEYGDHVRTALVSFWAALDGAIVVSWRDMVKAGAPFLRNPF
ncbi:Fungal transcriptional regulatory protein [Apiospora saccharicola]|uniref:Fungal transcriptional regulatory protein n=1 Tax=Apiospora saccharicola TaxID=335842 RepID=A0ABR1UGC9_9PEZI